MGAKTQVPEPKKSMTADTPEAVADGSRKDVKPVAEEVLEPALPSPHCKEPAPGPVEAKQAEPVLEASDASGQARAPQHGLPSGMCPVKHEAPSPKHEETSALALASLNRANTRDMFAPSPQRETEVVDPADEASNEEDKDEEEKRAAQLRLKKAARARYMRFSRSIKSVSAVRFKPLCDVRYQSTPRDSSGGALCASKLGAACSATGTMGSL